MCVADFFFPVDRPARLTACLQACPGVGDDILHTPLPFFDSPAYVSSPAPTGSDDRAIDLVFIDFIGDLVLEALNGVQTGKNYTMGDVVSYAGTHLNGVFGVFASVKWNN